MKKSEVFISLLIDSFKKYNISQFIFTRTIDETFLIKNIESLGIVYKANDARTAGYIATGMSEESQKPVTIICRGSNESRSLMSAMTEAYYRNLPIIAVTLGDEDLVDYSIEVKDTFKYSFNVSLDMLTQDYLEELNSAFAALMNERMPVHLSINLSNDREYTDTSILQDNDIREISQVSQSILQELANALTNEFYVFIGKDYITKAFSFNCKVNVASDYNDAEGAVSILLGASLANCRKKYIGVISERELLQDLNALGNRHINNKVLIIVFVKNKKKLINDFVNSLSLCCIDGFSIETVKESQEKPTIVMVDE